MREPFVNSAGLRDVPAPAGAVRAPALADDAALVRWTLPGASGEVVLDPAGRGPVLVPVPAHGASLAAALVEALDRAAAGRSDGDVRRGEAILWLTLAPGWTRPGRAPSEILAGQSGDVPGRTQHGQNARSRLAADAIQKIGSTGLGLVRQFPQRRRALAVYRRRLEYNFFRIDEQLKKRRRGAIAFGAASVVGLGSTFAAVPYDVAGVAATGGLLFALAALGVAVESIGRRRLEARRITVREWVARVVRREEQLDDVALDLARQLGSDDPWALAERFAELDGGGDGAAGAEERALRRALGERLARALALDPAPLADDGPWDAPRPCDAVSWPPDVAALEDAADPLAPVVGMARLLQRVERELPAPWPIVLWEPWSGAGAEERARRLMALSDAAAGRRVVAFVRS